MTKNTVFKIASILVLTGFALMYWSGKISETTNDNWQGIAGISLSCIGASMGLMLILSRIGK